MATTSLWRIGGYLGDVLIYVENPEKTTNPEFYEKTKATKENALSDVIDYAVDTNKTLKEKVDMEDCMEKFVSGINCSPSIAREEMMMVKQHFGKPDGTVAYHGYQSFAPGEATPEMAHEIGLKLAQNLWGDKYQVLVATHLDHADQIHNHFVINTVSFVDGIKFYRSKDDYWNMRNESDELCKEYGLSIPKGEKRGKHYAEWKAEQNGEPTHLSIAKADVDRAISESMTETQFYRKLKDMGYEITTGKYITVKLKGWEHGVRLGRRLGPRYSIEGINKRILGQDIPEMPPRTNRVYSKGKVLGSHRKRRKSKGFRALYFRYLYELGKIPSKSSKNSPKTRKFVKQVYKSELTKLESYSNQAKLLFQNKIDTLEQLFSFKEDRKAKLDNLIHERQGLWNENRGLREGTKLEENRNKGKEITKEIRELRKELKLCDSIEERSTKMKENIKREKSEKERKEKSYEWRRN